MTGLVNLTGSNEVWGLQFCFFLNVVSPQVSQTWFLTHTTSKLHLTSRECRCMHSAALQKRTVFPGEHFFYAIPLHQVGWAWSWCNFLRDFLWLSVCLRAFSVCALVNNLWWDSLKVSLSLHQTVCWPRSHLEATAAHDGDRFGSCLRFFPLLSSRFLREAFPCKLKRSRVYDEKKVYKKRLETFSHTANIWGHFFLCYFLQVCVSSGGERAGLQSPAAVPTASKKPGNSRFPPRETQTWVGMAQLPSVSPHFQSPHEIKYTNFIVSSLISLQKEAEIL